MWFDETIAKRIQRLSNNYLTQFDNFEQSWDEYNIFNTVNVETSTDESCRKCGASLCDYPQCSQCKEPIKYICFVCGEQTLGQFHRARFNGIKRLQTQSRLVTRRLTT